MEASSNQIQNPQKLSLGQIFLNLIGFLIGAGLTMLGAGLFHALYFNIIGIPFLAIGPGLMAREMYSLIPISKISYMRRWINMGLAVGALSSIIVAFSTAESFIHYDRIINRNVSSSSHLIGYYDLHTLIIIGLITLVGPTLIAAGILRENLSSRKAIVWWFVSWIMILLAIPFTWMLGANNLAAFSA